MKVAIRFGQLLYAVIGLWYVFGGGVHLLQGEIRGVPLILFGILGLFLIIVSFVNEKKSQISLITLATLNIGLSSASAYYILGEQYDLPIDRISSASTPMAIMAISLVLFILFWRKSQGEIGRTDSSSQENNIAP